MEGWTSGNVIGNTSSEMLCEKSDSEETEDEDEHDDDEDNVEGHWIDAQNVCSKESAPAAAKLFCRSACCCLMLPQMAFTLWTPSPDMAA